MSADVIFFRPKTVDDVVLKKIENQDADEMAEKYDFKFKAVAEIQNQGLVELMPYMRQVTMQRTLCNSRQCYIDAGMPADEKYMCVSYGMRELTLRWGDNNVVRIPRATLEKYNYVKTEAFYVWHEQHADVDMYGYSSNFVWDIVQEYLQKKYNDTESHTYTPHRLTKAETEDLMYRLVKATKDEEVTFYHNELAQILMALILNKDEELFVVGQN